MLPMLRNGDLVVARKHDEYETGDILVYAVPEGEPGEGVLIIHRIVGGDARSGYVLRGDNRDDDDPWRPTADEVKGEAVLDVPKLGLVLGVIASPLGLGLLAAILAFLFVLPRKQDERPEEKES
jgi:signal peptidase